ncbi:MAG TPA: isoprenylcysteine carboxylmethyltransferase family protein, partial [Candidatus Acidoferrum sp.]|nr:isoprenylcysteine carboxylmethyltransferase family protein [Candidatus Acidoferrum sp.]
PFARLRQADVIGCQREFHAMKPSALIVTLLPLAAIVLFLLNFARVPWTPLRIFGLFLVVAAGTALTVARFQLGNSFSIRPEATELVTHGIYARIRNPIYVFAAILIAGLLLCLDQPKYFWLCLILIPVQFMRARAEGRLLEEQFGDAYRQYKSRTWF